MNMNLAVKMKL